jgi:hypothetical protein
MNLPLEFKIGFQLIKIFSNLLSIAFFLKPISSLNKAQNEELHLFLKSAGFTKGLCRFSYTIVYLNYLSLMEEGCTFEQ